VVKDLEGLYSNVLTICVLINDNLLKEFLNLMGRKSHISAMLLTKVVSLLIPDQFILLVVRYRATYLYKTPFFI